MAKKEHFWMNIEGWSNEHDQGALLNNVLNSIGNNHLNICEIGVYCGRLTALWNVELLNKNIPYNYIAIDHFQGSAEHRQDRDYHAEVLHNLRTIMDRITIIKNHSVAEATNQPNNHFDLVYIDASHDFHSVAQDIDAWLPKVKSGAYLAGDDYITGHPGVIKAVDLILKPDKITRIGKQQWLYRKP